MREGQIKIPSGCAVAGVIDRLGRRFSGEVIIRSIAAMRDRSNGLGGGFAAYGIYPHYSQWYALHIFYDHHGAKVDCEQYLKQHFEIADQSPIPTRHMQEITDSPLIWRYFVNPIPARLYRCGMDQREYVARSVLAVNRQIDGAYVFPAARTWAYSKGLATPKISPGSTAWKNMKDTVSPPTAAIPPTPGWWGGAHPFGLLDYSVVHNGEISSYDTNRRTIEMYGYSCTLQTDTEVIAYIVDYLHRAKGLTFDEIAQVLAPPFWQAIEEMPPEKRECAAYLRSTFASLLVNGPFSIIVGFSGGLLALNDRLKLRSMVVGEKGDVVYFASEEAAIRVVEPEPDRVWAPKGGEPVIVAQAGGTER